MTSTKPPNDSPRTGDDVHGTPTPLTRDEPRFRYAYNVWLGIHIVVGSVVMLLLTGLTMGIVRLFHPLSPNAWFMLEYPACVFGIVVALSVFMIVGNERILRGMTTAEARPKTLDGA